MIMIIMITRLYFKHMIPSNDRMPYLGKTTLAVVLPSGNLLQPPRKNGLFSLLRFSKSDIPSKSLFVAVVYRYGEMSMTSVKRTNWSFLYDDPFGKK